MLDLYFIVLCRHVTDPREREVLVSVLSWTEVLRVCRALGRPDVILEQHHQHSVVRQGGEVLLVIHLQDQV